MPHVPYFEQLRTLFPELRIEQVSASEIAIGVEAHPTLVLCQFSRDGEFVILRDPWHAHLSDWADVIDLLRRILAGNARVIEQRRGSSLAGRWLEILDGEFVERSHTAWYLNPFDSDEWTLYGADDWNVTAHYACVCPNSNYPPFKALISQAGKVLSETIQRFRANKPADWMLSYLQEKCRISPPAGWRWSSIDENEIAFLVPLGWRYSREYHEDTQYHRFQPNDDQSVLWVTLQWSDPVPRRKGTIFEPISVTRLSREEIEDWIHVTWELVFGGVCDRMRAVFTLSINPHHAELIRSMEDNLSRARRLFPE
ncbi:MAG: hypothetical protein JST40_11265 [Armatimonadetes bacterium]|nr:hypothetical protein [Armatimonadota bacterium]